MPLNIHELRQRLDAEGVSPRSVSIDGSIRDECYCLLETSTSWEVFYSERGLKRDARRFNVFVDAAAHFLGLVIADPTTRMVTGDDH